MNKQLIHLFLLAIALSGFLKADLNLLYNQQNLPFLGKDSEEVSPIQPIYSLRQFQSGLNYYNPDLSSSNFSHFLSYNFDTIPNIQYPTIGAIWSPGYFQEYKSVNASFSLKLNSQNQRSGQDEILANYFAMGTSVQVGSNLKISGGAEINNRSLLANDVLFESDTYSLPISIQYSLNSNTQLSLNYEKSFTNTHDSATSYDDEKITVGINNLLLPQLETGIKIGVQTREDAKGRLNHKLAGGSSIRYKVNENTAIGSSVSKDFAIGPKGENMEKLQTTLEVDFALNELIFVGTNLAMLNYEYLDTGEETDLANAGLHFKYRDGDLFNLSAGYSLSTPDFDRKLNKRMGHLLNFSASIQF